MGVGGGALWLRSQLRADLCQPPENARLPHAQEHPNQRRNFLSAQESLWMVLSVITVLAKPFEGAGKLAVQESLLLLARTSILGELSERRLLTQPFAVAESWVQASSASFASFRQDREERVVTWRR